MTDINPMLSPPAPPDFPRRVLFMVAGLAPQIVTETLYYLAVRQQPAFIPTRIVVMTTSEGAAPARNRLFGDEPGWFARLLRDYNLPAIQFDETDIRVIPGPDGAPLADIRSEADNRAAADAITEQIRALTADPTCALHVSMAGGRKTLGFFAAYALSLYGRPQDRLSHVLVSKEFENNRDFFYPLPYHAAIGDGSEARLDTPRPEVMLADIPFVRMRDGLSEAFMSGRATYTGTVAAVQRLWEPPSLVLDLKGGRVIAGGTAIKLTPRLLALYVWMARKRLAGVSGVKIVKDRDDSVLIQNAKELLAEYRRLTTRDLASTEKALKSGLDYGYFSSNRRRLHEELHRALDIAAVRYEISRFGQHRNNYEFSLVLPPEAITILGD